MAKRSVREVGCEGGGNCSCRESGGEREGEGGAVCAGELSLGGRRQLVSGVTIQAHVLFLSPPLAMPIGSR
jgi:hypothetical protein